MTIRWGWKLFAALLALAPLTAPTRALSDAPAPPEARAVAPAEDEDDFDLDDDLAFHGGPHGGMGMGHGPGMGPGAGGPHGPRAHMGLRMGRGHDGRIARGFHGLMEQLDLTDAQREKMRAIHDRTQRSRIQARADLRIAMLDLRELMHAERPDRAAIDRQIDKVGQMRAAQHKAHAGALIDARALLTPEQQKKLRELQDRPRGGPGHRGDDTRDLEKPKR